MCIRDSAVSGEAVSVEEIAVEAGAACDGQRIQDVPWPRDCVVASLRRGRRVLIPHGDTLLQAGDILVVVAEEQARDALQRLCQR